MSFSVAAVISNHCVLQRNKPIAVFGYGDKGTNITVTLLDSKKKVLAKNSTILQNAASTAKGSNGELRWEIKLESQVAQTGCELKVDGDGQTISFTDIAIGEVWLAGGQSNMEFELQNCVEGPDALADKTDPNVRFYYTNKIGWLDDSFYEAEKNTCWQTWESEYKKSWSAVGYFFAKKLAADLGCVVGVIGCNWGGTSASAWMNEKYLEKDAELYSYIEDQENAVKGKSIEQQLKEYNDYLKRNDEWQQKCNNLFATVPGITWDDVQKKIGPCEWPGPRACNNPYRPSGLYETMLMRVCPYTMQGVIWYQGESDDHKPNMYFKLFREMIQNWRDDWNDAELPFIFVQLVNHRYQQDRDFKHWCLIREAQQKTHNSVKNAFMTCAFDLGKFNDIHPTAKQEVAERMETISLAEVYKDYKSAVGKKINVSKEEAYSPMLKNFRVQDDTIVLEFENASTGFNRRDDAVTETWLQEYEDLEKIQNSTVPEDFTGFEIAGEDKVFVPAKYAFSAADGKLNEIILKSDKVPNPKYARYAWFNYGPITIYGKNGLPVAPFRTDIHDSEVAPTEHAEVQQIMTVNTK